MEGFKYRRATNLAMAILCTLRGALTTCNKYTSKKQVSWWIMIIVYLCHQCRSKIAESIEQEMKLTVDRSGIA